jgi:hypothetical protein
MSLWAIPPNQFDISVSVLERSASKRRFPRYPLAISLSAKAERPYGATSLTGHTLDFCEGGLRAALDGEQLSPGEFVRLQLRVPQYALTLQPRATVRYRQGNIHGFEFLDLSALQLAAVRTYCRRLAERAECP